MSGTGPIIKAFNRVVAALTAQLAGKMDADAVPSAATKLATPFTINVTGDGEGNASGDGSAPMNISLSLGLTGVLAGTYPVVTVDTKGRVTTGRALQANDIPNLDAGKITTGTFSAARIPTLNQNTTGNAATADKWSAARSLTITGDGSWTINLDGSANVSGALTLANSGAVAGVYPKVTIDAKGRVTGGAALAASDIPALDTGKLTTGILPISRGGTGGGTQGDARTALGIGSMATRNVTISTAAPSGGSDGDVWFQY